MVGFVRSGAYNQIIFLMIFVILGHPTLNNKYLGTMEELLLILREIICFQSIFGLLKCNSFSVSLLSIGLY